MATNPYTNQIQNRNFLSPIGFKFALGKTPKVDFFCTNTRIPELSLGLAKQPTYLKDLDIPGEKLTFGDLTLRFLVDENMENYMAIHNWLTGLGFPETTQDYAALVKPVTAAPREIKEAKKAYDKVVDHLISEDYARTKEDADQIISGMSEDWYYLILQS